MNADSFCKLTVRPGIGSGMHAVRHTHATLMLKAGIPSKVAQERLGHASIVMTGDIYSHVLPGMQKEAAHAVEQALRRKKT